MYNYDLIISIFSKDENLEKTISSIKSLENFRYIIQKYDFIDDQAISNSDVLIWDLPYEQLTLSNVKKDAKVILCVDNYEENYENLTEVIIKPFNYEKFKYDISKIFKMIKLECDLQFSNTCLNTAINGVPGMVWFKTKEGIHTLLNKRFCEIVGKTQEDVTGQDHYSIWNVSKDDPNSGADICKKTEDKVIEAGHTLSFSESVKSQNGKMELVTYKSPLYDKNGNAVGTFGFGEDVTELKNLGAINDILLNSVPFGILIKDNNDIIRTVNRYFEEYFNVSKKEIIGITYNEWVEKTFKTGRNINNEGYIEGTTNNNNGQSKKFELRSNYIRDVFKNKTGTICIFRDVTLERNLEAEIVKKSNEDSMTGLYIRRYLDEFISKQSKDEMISLFSIDLDHFKSVNDTYGHQVGDKALILTAKTIKANFPCDLVFRMGGDEFLVVKVGNYDMEELKEEAQNLLDSISIRFSENNCFGNLSASVGIAQGTLENGIDEIYRQSDVALYEAKDEGRACYRVYNENYHNLVKL